MAQKTLIQIKDALIARIIDQTSLNINTCTVWTGTLADLWEQTQKTRNFPFCGVALEGMEVSSLDETVENNTSNEEYTWRLLIAFRNNARLKFSDDGALALLDSIRNALIGHDLFNRVDLTPLIVARFAGVESLDDSLVTGYNAEVLTSQIVQKAT